MSLVTQHPSLHFGSIAELAALKMEVKKLRLVVALLLVSLTGFSQSNLLPPLPPTNRVAHCWPAPKAQAAVTNIILTWSPYTNCWFEVLGTTNLAGTNWYHVTNTPIWLSTQSIPVTKPFELFKVETRFQP